MTEEKNKIIAGLLALFLGSFGIHKFYLNNTKAGVIMLVVFFLGIFLLGIPSMIIGLIAFIEAILYMVKSDEEFHKIYVVNKKSWF
jgi:TM2 domain-containing membrane protein YozV